MLTGLIYVTLAEWFGKINKNMQHLFLHEYLRSANSLPSFSQRSVEMSTSTPAILQRKEGIANGLMYFICNWTGTALTSEMSWFQIAF